MLVQILFLNKYISVDDTVMKFDNNKTKMV